MRLTRPNFYLCHAVRIQGEFALLERSIVMPRLTQLQLVSLSPHHCDPSSTCKSSSPRIIITQHQHSTPPHHTQLQLTQGAFDFIRHKAANGSIAAPEPLGLMLMVDGRVPPGAGVSSSSALTVS